MDKNLRFFFAIVIFSIFSNCIYSQNKVAFFSSVSSSEDESTINLTEELYFSKASLIPNISVVDYRNKIYTEDELQNLSSFSYIFYPEIQEDGDGWLCIFHGINVNTKEEIKSQKNYDSYYKILMDAKNDLDSFFASLNFSNQKTNENSINSTEVFAVATMEVLAGTWKGEQFIDKIIILRGGRGFVIFQNGASMNISVSISDNTLIAKQNCMSNASFFPEISRETALKMAPSAKPIEWKMKIKTNSTLEGTKNTLLENNNIAEFSNIPVVWTKLQ